MKKFSQEQDSNIYFPSPLAAQNIVNSGVSFMETEFKHPLLIPRGAMKHYEYQRGPTQK